MELRQGVAEGWVSMEGFDMLPEDTHTQRETDTHTAFTIKSHFLLQKHHHHPQLDGNSELWQM